MQSESVGWNFTITIYILYNYNYVIVINMAQFDNAISLSHGTHSCLRRPKPVKVPFSNCVMLLSYRFLQVDRGLE